ncbi:MAG: hypothetical protein ACRENG_37360, partial [bacterium]
MRMLFAGTLMHFFLGHAFLYSQTPGHSPGELIVKLRTGAGLSKTNTGRHEITSAALASNLQKIGAHEIAPLGENAPPDL